VQNSPSQESAAVPLAGVVCFSVFLLFFYRTRVGMKDHTSAKNWHMGLWEKLCKCLGIFRLWGKGKRSVTVKQHTAVLSPGPLAYWPLIPEIGIYNLFWTILERFLSKKAEYFALLPSKKSLWLNNLSEKPQINSIRRGTTNCHPAHHIYPEEDRDPEKATI
jgi:hypothetical protein